MELVLNRRRKGALGRRGPGGVRARAPRGVTDNITTLAIRQMQCKRSEPINAGGWERGGGGGSLGWEEGREGSGVDLWTRWKQVHGDLCTSP